MYVDPKEFREAQVEAGHIRRWRRLTEPVEQMTFAARPVSRMG
jgi:hypothetical protein